MKKYYTILIILFTISHLCFAGFPITEKKSSIAFDVECDNIIFRDGEEVSAKIIEITPDLIKYRKCSNLEGPLISVSRKSILMIRYADGTKEIISIGKRIKKNDHYIQEPNLQSGLAFVSVIFAVFSSVIFYLSTLNYVFALAGFVCGLISLLKSKDKNKVMSLIGLIASFFLLLFLILS